MFKTKFRLCEVFGIPLYVDITFAILLILFVSTTRNFGYGLTAALILAISVVLHELGHALTARAFGYVTRDITISLLGGCAALISLPRKASQELVTAIMGPVVSFVLSGIGFAGYLLLPLENLWVWFCFYYMAWMNLMLGGFNLLPGFPMDGGRIFRSVLRSFMTRPQATFVAMWVGRAVAILIGLWGLHALFSGGTWGFVRIAIAWSIWQDGYREYLMAKMESNWEYCDYRAKASPPPYGGDTEEMERVDG